MAGRLAACRMRTRCHSAPHSLHFPSPTLSARFLRKVRLPTRIEPRTTSIPLGASSFFISSSALPTALEVSTQYSYAHLRSLRCPFPRGRRDTFPFLTSPSRVGRIISGSVRQHHSPSLFDITIITTTITTDYWPSRHTATMATKAARTRLTREYKTMQKEPTPYVVAHPCESNILE